MVVCISSICGSEVIEDAPITYSVSKAALNAYVKVVSRSLGLDGIRINAIALGNIFFKGSLWERKLLEDKLGVENMLMKNVPMLRLGKAEEVANLVAYLVSSNAEFATGSIWTLDGGQTRA